MLFCNSFVIRKIDQKRLNFHLEPFLDLVLFCGLVNVYLPIPIRGFRSSPSDAKVFKRIFPSHFRKLKSKLWRIKSSSLTYEYVKMTIPVISKLTDSDIKVIRQKRWRRESFITYFVGCRSSSKMFIIIITIYCPHTVSQNTSFFQTKILINIHHCKNVSYTLD